ncbi:hypothetical protein [Gracilibacillus sp. YIM 98692]|nr:hypothetical protein [Gracilibacillus sp. YIM 98692]
MENTSREELINKQLEKIADKNPRIKQVLNMLEDESHANRVDQS